MQSHTSSTQHSIKVVLSVPGLGALARKGELLHLTDVISEWPGAIKVLLEVI